MVRHQNGFTLTELMVVIAVVGIIALIATPNIVTGLPKYRLKSASNELASHMRKARSRAVKERRIVRILFDTQKQQYSIDGEWFPRKGLPGHYGSGVAFGRGKAGAGSAVTFQGSPPRVTFNPQGLGNAGSVYLRNSRGGSYKITVNTAGRISVSVAARQ